MLNCGTIGVVGCKVKQMQSAACWIAHVHCCSTEKCGVKVMNIVDNRSEIADSFFQLL